VGCKSQKLNGSWPLWGLTACLFSLRRENKQYLPKVDTSFI